MSNTAKPVSDNKRQEPTVVAIVDEKSLRDKIYIVRGVQVMLDFELAELYGYETKSFNQQVRRNVDKFPEDFRFQITREELDNLVRSQKVTSRNNVFKGQSGGSRYLPWCYTESGVYMLMTILKSDVAVAQSIALIRTFRAMKEYIIESQPLLSGDAYAYLLQQMNETNKELDEVKSNMLTTSDLPKFMKLFDQGIQNEEILILDGQPFKADVAYQKIYRSAKKSIIIVDDYIGVKTLQHLVHARPGVKLTIISDNKLRLLKLSEYNDFLKEYPSKVVDFIKTQDRTHDRYIILDNGTAEMKVYHCGASSKDAGKRITTISKLSEVTEYQGMIASLLSNNKLILK